MATAYFYELMIRMTEAKADQEHMEIVIYSKPSIPDRTDYILGKSKANPVYDLIEVGRKLVSMEVEHIAIPCITGHYFHDILSEEIKVPVIHAVKETAHYLKMQGVRCAGIMATEGTIHSRLFQDELALSEIETVLPTKENQKEISDLIYKSIKANQPIDFSSFQAVADRLSSDGAEINIIGCTELSLIKREFDIGPGFIDAMEVLAMRSILLSEAKLKEEYHSLITK